MKIQAIFLVLFTSLLSGCGLIGSHDNGVISMLSNRGPVSLSDENPYIASNVLLAQEIEQSNTLKGFIEHQGKPDAIQIEKGIFRPTVMYFYYANSKEAYILRRNKDQENEWLIVGPTGLPEELARRIKPAQHTPPLVNSRARPSTSEQYYQNQQKNYPEEREIQVIYEEPADIGRPQQVQEPIEQELDPAAFSRVTNQRVIDAPSGDIIHKVSYTGETLRLIAEWYTGDVQNAGRLSKINSLNDANMLHLNQVIRIPRYLIKNRQPMPLSAVQEYHAKLYPPSTQ